MDNSNSKNKTINKYNNKMKCLILGGNGFIGSNLCNKLVDLKYKVRVFDKDFTQDEKVLYEQLGVEYISGDFHNKIDLKRALEEIDIVVHLVCTTLPENSNEAIQYDIKSNVISTINLLEIAHKNNVKKII